MVECEKEKKSVKYYNLLTTYISGVCVNRAQSKTSDISSSAARFFGMKKEFNQYDLFEPIAETLNMSSMVDIMPTMYSPIETLEPDFYQTLGEIFESLGENLESLGEIFAFSKAGE